MAGFGEDIAGWNCYLFQQMTLKEDKGKIGLTGKSPGKKFFPNWEKIISQLGVEKARV